jgi:hypothetical protein
MAIYSTFFLARPEDLAAGFPGWKLPLVEPVARQRKNPFTGEVMNVTSRVPDWDDDESDAPELPEIQVVPISGDYEAYLESRIPEFVRHAPHWCAKNLTNIEIEPLVAAATGVEISLGSAIYAPPGSGSGIETIPEGLVEILMTTDEPTLQKIAQAWAAALSTPEYTHSMNGERIDDDRTADEMRPLVHSLASVARRRTPGQSMYLLIEA